MYQKGDTPDLLLWQLERNAVPNSCVGDVRTIIEAIEPHLLERRFERHHTGYISTRSVRIGGPDGPSRRALLFTDRNNGNTYQLQTLPNPVGNNRMFLADDALYYIGAAQESSPMNQDIPSIYRYELTSDTLTETFRVKHDENPVISSYYVADGWLYYLSGPTSSKWCLSKPSSGCGLDFYRAPLDALYDIELIATSTDAVSIYGYDPQFDILYLSNGYGDAGCLTHGILVFDGESIAPAAFYGVCKGDPEYVVYQTEMETLQASFEAEVAPSIFHRSGEYDASEWDPDWKSATFYLVPGSGEEAAVRDSSSTRTKTLIAQ